MDFFFFISPLRIEFIIIKAQYYEDCDVGKMYLDGFPAMLSFTLIYFYVEKR